MSQCAPLLYITSSCNQRAGGLLDISMSARVVSVRCNDTAAQTLCPTTLPHFGMLDCGLLCDESTWAGGVTSTHFLLFELSKSAAHVR